MSAKMTAAALFGAVALASFAISYAQPAPHNSGSDEIVVTGERMRTILHDFVADISTPSGENQIARWDHRICTGVFGRSLPSVGVVSIFLITSMPEVTRANTGCLDAPGVNQSR